MAEPNTTELLLRLAALEAQVETLTSSGDGPDLVEQEQADLIWILLSGFLVFWMHAGFTMLELGSVQHKNAVNIMFKNLGTIAIGAFFFYLLGFGFAYGTENLKIVDREIDGETQPFPDPNTGSFRFIGSGNFALDNYDSSITNSFYFQAVFAATAATIVSGAVAGRVTLPAYFLMAAWLTSFVYPVVVHWVWASGGWVSAFQFTREDTIFVDDNGCGMIDFAGSGVVHMTGGVAALWTAMILGPRLGRFDADMKPVPIPPHNISLQTLGVFILWFGWYGFNCGSTLAFNGPVASLVAVNTLLSPSVAILTSILIGKGIYGHYDIAFTLNSTLAGLVGVTAGCATMEPWGAVIVGFTSTLVYAGASYVVLNVLKVDDPVDAIAVHGACGMWGVLATGFLSSPDLILVAYSVKCRGWSGIQIATQLVGILAIVAWVSAMVVPLAYLLNFKGLLHVPHAWEERGLDTSEHGGHAAFVHEDQATKDLYKGSAPSSRDAEFGQADPGSKLEKGEAQSNESATTGEDAKIAQA